MPGYRTRKSLSRLRRLVGGSSIRGDDVHPLGVTEQLGDLPLKCRLHDDYAIFSEVPIARRLHDLPLKCRLHDDYTVWVQSTAPRTACVGGFACTSRVVVCMSCNARAS